MKDKKVRGEWAEMKFMTAAVEHGLCVSKPYGDSNSYDLVVGRPGALFGGAGEMHRV